MGRGASLPAARSRSRVRLTRGHGEGDGIEEVLTAPRAPWQNAFVERFIGSARRECFDHVIVFNEAGLHRVMTGYCSYHERSRTHLSLNKDTPIPRPVTPPKDGAIVAIPEVGGLHHRPKTPARPERTSRRRFRRIRASCVDHLGHSPVARQHVSRRNLASGRDCCAPPLMLDLRKDDFPDDVRFLLSGNSF